MKNVLCFGDSNTWGFMPESISLPCPERHPHDVRWTGVLARELGGGYRVIEEGQNGRTTVHDDPFALARNGKTVLPAILESHKPLDLVVLMLGTNDLKAVYGVSPGEIADPGQRRGPGQQGPEAAADVPAGDRRPDAPAGCGGEIS